MIGACKSPYKQTKVINQINTIMKTKVRTIDVNCKEWFDKLNGNSYFAGTVTINFGMKSQKSFNMPFQYGYGNQFEHEAELTLRRAKVIQCDDYKALWRYCRDNNIILRTSLKENCKQKELKEY
jgi:hypothetical protein